MKVIIDLKHLNQAGENLKIDLQDIIDNRNDEYVVAARDISYYVSYYSISKALGNNHAVYSDRKLQIMYFCLEVYTRYNNILT